MSRPARPGARQIRSGYILAAILIGLTVVGCALPLLIHSTGRAVFTVCVVAWLAMFAKPIGKAIAPVIRALW